MEPTKEQSRIKAVFDSGLEFLIVNAGAGTGKTETLRYITEDDGRRGLYIAFNTRNAKEAARKFSHRVECRTTHSLAFRAMDVGRRFRDKLGGSLSGRKLARQLGIEHTYRDISPSHMASQAREAIRRYQHSADEHITDWHCRDHLKDFEYFKRFWQERMMPGNQIPAHAQADERAYTALIRGYAQELWARMTNPKDPTPMDHDTYLKLWALERPTLDYDYILLDEGQDTNNVVLDLFLNQPSQRVVVGDKFQAVYQWRGAINALTRCQEFEHHRLNLTQSFRFGQPIADVANRILRISPEGCDITLSGSPECDSTLGEVDWPSTHICRTNVGVLDQARRLMLGGYSFSVVGSIRDACEQIESVYWLREDERDRVTHPAIKIYESYRDVEDEIARGDITLQRIVKFLDEEADPVQVVNDLKQAEVPPAAADVILTTAHKAKGLEWRDVSLAEDFRTPDKISEHGPPLHQADVNLLYVAATRAASRLQLNSYLRREQCRTLM
jgi:superfamily I DNA/RNA helicase